MISWNGTSNITAIYWQGKKIVAKYYGSNLVWEPIRSCYGSGKWVPAKPWLDNDFWKNE